MSTPAHEGEQEPSQQTSEQAEVQPKVEAPSLGDAKIFFSKEELSKLEAIILPDGTVLTENGQQRPEELIAEAKRRGEHTYGLLQAKKPIRVPSIALPHQSDADHLYLSQSASTAEKLDAYLVSVDKSIQTTEQPIEEQTAGVDATWFDSSSQMKDEIDGALTVPELKAHADGFGKAALNDLWLASAVRVFQAAGTLEGHKDEIRTKYVESQQNRSELGSEKQKGLQQLFDSLRKAGVDPMTFLYEDPEQHLSAEVARERADSWERAADMTEKEFVDLLRSDGAYALHLSGFGEEALRSGGLIGSVGHNVRAGRDPNTYGVGGAPSEAVHFSVNTVYRLNSGAPIYGERPVDSTVDATKGELRLQVGFITHPGYLLTNKLSDKSFSHWAGEGMSDVAFRGTVGEHGESPQDEIPLSATIMLIPKNVPVDPETGRSRITAEDWQQKGTAQQVEGAISSEDYWLKKYHEAIIRGTAEGLPKSIFFYSGSTAEQGMEEFLKSKQIPTLPQGNEFKQVLDLYDEREVESTFQAGSKAVFYENVRKNS